MKASNPLGRCCFRLLRVIRNRPRLFFSMGLGLVVFGALAATHWRLLTRMLVAWDVAAAIYLVFAFELMAHSTVEGIRRRAAKEDEGEPGILILINAAAVASLVAIVAALGVPAGRTGGPGQVPLAAITIVLSWAMIHTIMALHYAHEFYDEHAGGGIHFPGHDQEPHYFDFVYFSFCIGMTSQVSDVSVSSKGIRRTVAAHATISFFFNTALLALAVNIAASAL